MENKKYVVCRDNIYVGEVVRTDSIYRYEGDDDFFRTKPRQLSTGSWRSYRSMLFVPNEDKLSNDLLYRTPNYPILNVTDDETCLNLGKNSIVIKGACNLAALLEYFGYKKDLTYEDIMKIRKTFFTGRFAKDSCQLFGYKETMVEDLTFRSNGKVVTDSKELERRRKQFRAEQRAGHRIFSGVSDSPLPREYWDVLDDRGDNTLMDVIEGWNEKMNAFAPHRQEGPVKRLKRF
ncbi:MAG: hypothetical protein IJD92_00405 [Bacilli bacterium]|nr:hypothetical protein [Bacilli bacterium]